MERRRWPKEQYKVVELSVHIFYWPDRCLEYLVDTKFILFSMLTRYQVCHNNMIMSTIHGWEDIQKQYIIYYNKYLARQQPRARRPRKTPKRTSPKKTERTWT